jgi:hypothetical protein
MIQLYNQLELEYKRKLAADFLQTSVENIKIEYLFAHCENELSNIHLIKDNSLILIDYFYIPPYDSSPDEFASGAYGTYQGVNLPTVLSVYPNGVPQNVLLKDILIQDFTFDNKMSFIWLDSCDPENPMTQTFDRWVFAYCYYYRFSVIK